jgi:archaemetzincin
MPGTRKEIKIVSVGQVQADVLEYLTFVLSGSFAVRCEIQDLQLDARRSYNAKRRQFDSNQILQQLIDLRISEDCKVLGVTEQDLFVPIFTFVFGLAQVDGGAALMSTCRLHQQFYGLPEDKDLFLLRCEKEAAHELGHAYGLAHCASYECVMHFSNSIEQVDLKSAMFCTACSAFDSNTARMFQL